MPIRASGVLRRFRQPASERLGLYKGLWAAQWLKDVEGLDRAAVVHHLFAMAVALSLGAILLGVAADRLRRRGVGPEVLLGLVAAVFIATQFALILRLPLPSYLQWSVVAAVGAATVLSFAIWPNIFRKSSPDGPMGR